MVPNYYDIGAPDPQTLLEGHEWDFVVLNDHTQAPLRNATRAKSIATLQTHIVPRLLTTTLSLSSETAVKSHGGESGNDTTATTAPPTQIQQGQEQQQATILILLQTFSYKIPQMRGTQDLPAIGYVETFSELLREGYEEYRSAILASNDALQDVRIAPVGQAVLHLYLHDPDLWEQLYSWDDFHPSPLGTWLEACCLHLTIHNGDRPPPRYNPSWWDDARRMQPPEQHAMPLPTPEQAETLRQVAMKVCGNGGVGDMEIQP
mmetsp:Transcript_2041/g.5644  ORF Transcript_2041/g.5644 Transcript_2041/m.5644 type:complete len:262 (-) Transcript_2041:1679-2464(-)